MKTKFFYINHGEIRLFDNLQDAEIALANDVKEYISKKTKELFYFSEITKHDNGDETWTPIEYDRISVGNYASTNSLDGLSFRAKTKEECDKEIFNKTQKYIQDNQIFSEIEKKEYEKSIGFVPMDPLKKVLEANGFWCSGNFDGVDIAIDLEKLKQKYTKEKLKSVFELNAFTTLKEVVFDENSIASDFSKIDYKIYTKNLNGGGGQPQKNGVLYRTFNNGQELFDEVIKNGGKLLHPIIAQETFYDTDEVRYVVNLWGVVNGTGDVHFYPVEITPEASQPHGQYTEVLDIAVVNNLKHKIKLMLSNEGIKNAKFGVQFLEGKDNDYYPIDINFTPKWQEQGLYAKLKPDYIADVFKFCFDVIPSIPDNNLVCVYRFFDCVIPENKVFNFEKFENICNSMGCGTFNTGRVTNYNSCVGDNIEAPPLMCEKETYQEAKQTIENLNKYLHENTNLFTDSINSPL